MSKKNGIPAASSGINTVDKTFEEMRASRDALIEIVQKHPEAFEAFSAAADRFNRALDSHKAALKACRTGSPFYSVTIPKTFICESIEEARKFLGPKFDEYVETKYQTKRDAIRNALAAGSMPGLEMIFREVEETPRHSGPKPIDISALAK